MGKAIAFAMGMIVILIIGCNASRGVGTPPSPPGAATPAVTAPTSLPPTAVPPTQTVALPTATSVPPTPQIVVVTQVVVITATAVPPTMTLTTTPTQTATTTATVRSTATAVPTEPLREVQVLLTDGTRVTMWVTQAELNQFLKDHPGSIGPSGTATPKPLIDCNVPGLKEPIKDVTETLCESLIKAAEKHAAFTLTP